MTTAPITAADFLRGVLATPPARWPDHASIGSALARLEHEFGAACRAEWAKALNAAFAASAGPVAAPEVSEAPGAPEAPIGSPARPWMPGDPIPGAGGAEHSPPPPPSTTPDVVVGAPRRGVADDFDAFVGIAAIRGKTALTPPEVMHGSGLKMIEAGERLLAADAGIYGQQALALILAGNKLLKEAAPFMVAKRIEVAGAGGSAASHEENLAATWAAMQAVRAGG